jgi:hypothetical protein
VPFKDFVRVFFGGIQFGWQIRRLYRDYDRSYW